MIETKEQLEEFIIQNWNEVNKYLDQKFSEGPTPFYTSVDIRESASKLAPVDNNLYPAGFNNLCALDLDSASTQIRQTLESITPKAQKVCIIPESHTKNTFYLDHLAILGKTVRDAGYDICFASPDPKLFEQSDELSLLSHSKYDVLIEKLSLSTNSEIEVKGIKQDIVILNNDQSTPLPLDWPKIKTPVTPSPLIGWTKRQKSKHFKHYKDVVDEFGEQFDIVPDLLQAKFQNIDTVDFSSRLGLEPLVEAVDSLMQEAGGKGKVFVKASQGTYGMGISVVSSGEEILNMNKKMRNKMDTGKNSLKFTSVLVQEGIETILKYDDMPAEVTIYLVGGKSVGGFMRANSERDSSSNLNSRGMVFKKFCISEIRQNQDHAAKEAVYSVIARLSTLAGARELKEIL
jgi:glutamate--cysteine ligase